MRLRFRCDCPAQAFAGRGGSPRCVRCGETRVARVLDAEAPRIQGHGRGPLVTSVALEAIRVPLAPDGPLRLKEPKETHAAIRQNVRAH